MIPAQLMSVSYEIVTSETVRVPIDESARPSSDEITLFQGVTFIIGVIIIIAMIRSTADLIHKEWSELHEETHQRKNTTRKDPSGRSEGHRRHGRH